MGRKGLKMEKKINEKRKKVMNHKEEKEGKSLPLPHRLHSTPNSMVTSLLPHNYFSHCVYLNKVSQETSIKDEQGKKNVMSRPHPGLQMIDSVNLWVLHCDGHSVKSCQRVVGEVGRG